MKTILIVLVFILSGCSVTTPTVTDYRIDPDVTISNKSTNSQKRSIKVMPIFVNTSLATNNMRYRIGEYKEYAFTQSAWSESPNRAIANKLVNILEASNLFHGVYGYKSSKKGDLVLEFSLNEFIQSFNELQNSSSVTLNISYNLIERKTRKLIASKIITKTMQTDSLDAQGGVKALNSILAQTLEETVDWLGENSQ
ncbi:ABC-type transport auxiliary lipoprotein family protein [Sulfurimonas sp. C5]|uniref:ABC-type transport auxiliary lipoprotein family protein n=1 Tax=Sulfurimonas sp. C5 TaxID=3036947 RepID=UPI002454CDFC|nr:ABC-type transport auxiliary lipoprotein family protein [Sulfurimonas sp. C5]MDH4944963.1 ABC-type transport auxiliary lipoprotein family protein [Sulfurimonas sp. C5]